MFNFFKKSAVIEPPKIDNSLASISYKASENGSIIIDISLKDYEQDSILGLCRILDTLSSDGFYLETINMIQQGLLRDNNEEVLLQVITHVGSKARIKIINDHNKEMDMDEPCIKPSDML
jgi:hypothetical protein